MTGAALDLDLADEPGEAEPSRPDLDDESAVTVSTTDVTVVEGSSFCVSDRVGDISAHRTHGVFFQDTRIVSEWSLLVDDAPLEPLQVVSAEPYTATFLTRALPRAGKHDSTLVVERHRWIGAGMREDVVIRNYGSEAAGITVQLAVDADFADVFDVKDGRHVHHPAVHRSGGTDLHWSVGHGDSARAVRVRGTGAMVVPGSLVWRVAVPAHGSWQTSVEVLASLAGDEVATAYPLGAPMEQTRPARRMKDWRAASPVLRSGSPALDRAVRRSVADLGGLRISDPLRPDIDVVAAGAPWFMALFGRDSLLTSALAMAFDPSLVRGTLQTLARYQGRTTDPMSEEQPGRILHEVRFGMDPSKALGASQVYYGSVDATPLFVMLVDEALRWGLPIEEARALLPAVDAALGWLTAYGDVDGDGFVEYARTTDRGIANQGWKDSHDSIAFADGTPARGPIALSEVQGYTYGAYRARAHLADVLGLGDGAVWNARALALRQAYDDAFWDDGLGCHVLALDGDKRRVDVLATNQAHCLWTGLALPDRAAAVADRLTSSELFTGWGLRTLGTGAAAYNPISYHNGSVWPHDNALAVAGLARYGLAHEAGLLAAALVRASVAFDGRLPELFCGFDTDEVPVPVPYPTSCMPQAWAAASPISLVRSVLGLEVCVPHATVAVAPAVPQEWQRLILEGLPVGEDRLDLDTADPRVVIAGAHRVAVHRGTLPCR